MPLVNGFDRRNPTPVIERAAELHDPRAHAIGDALQQPEPKLGGALDRIFPAVGVVVADAGNTGNRLAAHHATENLCVPSRGPWWHDGGVAALAISGNHFGPLADARHLGAVNAAHVHQAACLGIYLSD